MKKLVKNGENYSLQEVNGGAAVLDFVKAPVKPFLGEAMTSGDGLIAGTTFFLVGAMVGGTVGYKWVKKTQQAYNSFRGVESDALDVMEA